MKVFSIDLKPKINFRSDRKIHTSCTDCWFAVTHIFESVVRNGTPSQTDLRIFLSLIIE